MLSDHISDALSAHAGRSSAGLQSAELAALESPGDDEVREALAELREDQRLAVYHADVEGLRYKEIALILDIPEGTVMSRLDRGRRALRELLLGVASERGYLPAGVAA